jgi:hypothetical protein
MPDEPETIMPDEKRIQNQPDQFAVAMGLGQKLSVWAQKNGVPRRTCNHSFKVSRLT